MLDRKYEILRHCLDEESLRLCAAADAMVLGKGGLSFVAKASGLPCNTITDVLRHLDKSALPSAGPAKTAERIRRPGGGRKRLAENNPNLLRDLDKLINPIFPADPQSPLRWTCKSTKLLSKELQAQGHQVSQRTVWTLLDQLGYRMGSNRKIREDNEHPDRDAQFFYISKKVQQFHQAGFPVISVYIKKTEPNGRVKHEDREWQRGGQHEEVDAYDFTDNELGKISPYDAHNLAHDQGLLYNRHTNQDAADFAVATVCRWWRRMGINLYPQPTELLIVADGGGTQDEKSMLVCKMEAQRLAQELNMPIHVCHVPPGTSKWNNIEHRMFCNINENWHGRPLESQAVVIDLIANTCNPEQGRKIEAEIEIPYPATDIKTSVAGIEKLAIVFDKFKGELNYKIYPRKNQ